MLWLGLHHEAVGLTHSDKMHSPLGTALKGASMASSASLNGKWGAGAAGLLDHDVDLVAVLHLELVGSVIILEPFAIEDEAALVAGEALSLAVGVHQLLELRGSLDLEEDLRAVLRLDLDVDVLGVGGARGLLGFGHLCVSCLQVAWA